MARLIVVVDVDLAPTLHDPHEVADQLMDVEFPTFIPGAQFKTEDGTIGSFVSAEWES
jgi:hypothetical protein